VAGEFGWRKGGGIHRIALVGGGCNCNLHLPNVSNICILLSCCMHPVPPHSHSLTQRNWQNGMTKFCTQLTILNRISKDGAAFLAPLSAENLITFCLFCVLTNRIIGPKVRPVTAASPQLSHSNSWPHLRAGFGFRLWFRVGFGMFNECRAKFWKTWAILK